MAVGDEADEGHRGLRALGEERYATTRQTAHEFVRDVLRRAILNGELASGARLVQAELAAMLEVSTTPVREALRDLASEGLVRFDPHRGAVVHELTAEELHEIYRIRSLLEPEAMRHAAPKITDELIARLERLHERMLHEPHSAEWVDSNRAFHMAVYERTGSRRLASIIASLQDASVMYIGASLQADPHLRDEANRDHGRILEALRRRDGDAAATAILDHLTMSMRVLEGELPPDAADV